MGAEAIQMVDLRRQYERLRAEIDPAMRAVLEQSSFINGPAVKAFTAELSAYLGGVPVVTCGNGTDALQIALMALDLKAGDEVIVPAFTYIAAAEAALLLGLVMGSFRLKEINPLLMCMEGICFGLAVGALVTSIFFTTGVLAKVRTHSKARKAAHILRVVCPVIVAICIAACIIVTVL